ncbi:cytoskeleton-associated protein 2-like [Clarias gariepinus]|uniref:cytoskeleton-associated protein 2-like n=1 Tax=Clarias gariepinus TaxID=13013 RepID=UPI00234C5A12|nr:cytoskeleton-associated protein 2-like [Clarias gariepinus]
MGMTDEDRAKLSRIEIRKQKLAEYLAAKGRLQPPNPKPYLKSSAVLTKAPGGAQKSHTSVKGKENSAPSATTAKKDISKGNAPVEKNKNLRILPKAPSAVLPCLPLKPTVAQTLSQQARTRCKETARVVRNASVKEQQTKPDVHTSVTTQRQDKTVKKGPVSVSIQAQPSHRASMNARTSTIKTDLQKRRLVTGSEKLVQKSQISCPTMKGRLTTTVPRCMDTKSSIIKGAAVTLQNTRETNNLNKNNFDVKKPLNRYPVGKPDRSEKTQTNSQNTRLLNKVENNPRLTRTQRSSIPVTARQRSDVLSAISKTENARKSITVAVAGVKNLAPHRQQRRTTFILPSKPNVPAPVPQTLPRPTKTSSLTRGPVQLKTPKSTVNPGTDGVRTVPLDDRTKLSTAQEERLRKLQAWRESKGITYKRPPMPVQPARRKTTVLPPQGYWSTIEREDEVHGFVCAVDQSLNDCIKLLQQGCPAGHVRDVLSRVPIAQKFAKYWICQVRLMEQEGNLDVLPTFEEAVRLVREPVDELRSVVFEILKKKDVKASLSERQNDLGGDEDGEHVLNTCTPKAVGALIRGEKGDSAMIKYKITATPGGKRSQQRPGHFNGHEIRFLTPVRRSLRIEKSASRYPAVLQEHDPCVTSYHELLAEGKSLSQITSSPETPPSPLYVYRENEALKEQVQIQLVYDDNKE